MDIKTGQETEVAVVMMDVYQEFNELSEKLRIMKFKSRVSDLCFSARGLYAGRLGALFECDTEFSPQKVQKNYAFEVPDVPTQSDYLEVRYSVSNDLGGCGLCRLGVSERAAYFNLL